MGGMLAAGMLAGCTEKTEVALRVLRDKAENKMMETAGEAEVAIELYRREFAGHKEHLVRLKTLMAVYQESLDQAYAANDDRRIQLYTRNVNLLTTRIPEAEKALMESLATLDREKEELRLLKDEIASLQAMGGYEGNESVISAAEKRREVIRDLTQRLREKAKRAKALLDTDAFLKQANRGQA
jgi:23S rRNA A2030 N6-methylase RlmJ